MTENDTPRAKQLVARTAPKFSHAVWLLRHVQDYTDDVNTQLLKIRERVDDLERAVQENRRLNRRLAELTDIVQELLVPAVDRDDDRLRELLDKYSDKL